MYGEKVTDLVIFCCCMGLFVLYNLYYFLGRHLLQRKGNASLDLWVTAKKTRTLWVRPAEQTVRATCSVALLKDGPSSWMAVLMLYSCAGLHGSGAAHLPVNLSTQTVQADDVMSKADNAQGEALLAVQTMRNLIVAATLLVGGPL